MLPVLKKNTRGAILILALIIASSMTIIAIELALFVMSSIQQAKNSDATVIGRLAAESGVENALYQILKNDWIDGQPFRSGEDTLGSAKTSFLKPTTSDIDPTKLSSKAPIISRGALEQNQSMVIDAYENIVNTGTFTGTGADTLRVEWNRETCEKDSEGNVMGDTNPEKLEISAVHWKSGPINWDNDADVTPLSIKETNVMGGTKHYALVDLASTLGTAFNSTDPLIFQIKAAQCSIFGVEVSLRAGGSNIPIPNYFTIHADGIMSGINRSVTTVIPIGRETHSGLFDFTLFSQKDLCKDESMCQP